MARSSSCAAFFPFPFFPLPPRVRLGLAAAAEEEGRGFDDRWEREEEGRGFVARDGRREEEEEEEGRDLRREGGRVMAIAVCIFQVLSGTPRRWARGLARRTAVVTSVSFRTLLRPFLPCLGLRIVVATGLRARPLPTGRVK